MHALVALFTGIIITSLVFTYTALLGGPTRQKRPGSHKAVATLARAVDTLFGRRTPHGTNNVRRRRRQILTGEADRVVVRASAVGPARIAHRIGALDHALARRGRRGKPGLTVARQGVIVAFGVELVVAKAGVADAIVVAGRCHCNRVEFARVKGWTGAVARGAVENGAGTRILILQQAQTNVRAPGFAATKLVEWVQPEMNPHEE